MSALISLTAAKKRYGKTTAFSDVDLHIGQGDIIALAGPNGGGKTTLLRCLMGMVPFDNPRGQEILGISFPITVASRGSLLYLPDDDSLIEELTAEEYFRFIASTYGVNLERVSQALDALERLDFDLLQANTIIKTYSHGMRKKVQLASMVIPDVKLMIIDEPTNGLDPTAIILAIKFIEQFKSSRLTIVISTHNLAFAQKLANRVILLKNKVLYDGPVKWVLREQQAETLEEAYANIVLSQRQESSHDA